MDDAAASGRAVTGERAVAVGATRFLTDDPQRVDRECCNVSFSCSTPTMHIVAELYRRASGGY